MLGILGLVCCALFGIFAWVMGNEDIRQIEAKRMDPAGLGSTQAGRVCGIISVVLSVVSTLFYLIALGAAA